VMFECTILFAGLATVGAMFLLNGLPNVRRKAFDPGLTRDRFAILIEAPVKVEEEISDESNLRQKKEQFKAFQEAEVTEFLKSTGAKEVKSVYAEGWF